MKNEPVKHVYSVGGFSFFGSGTNMAMLFVGLKDWSERTDPALGVGEIVNRINGRFMSDPQMFVLAMNVPALPELGNSSGFDFRLQDHGGIGYERLVEAREELLSPGRCGPQPGGRPLHGPGGHAAPGRLH